VNPAAKAAVRGPARQPLDSLRVLLDQQPDRGLAILRSLHRSMDPEELRAAIDAQKVAPDARAGLWPLVTKPKVEAAALAAFVAAYALDPISEQEAASQKFQTKEDWFAYATAPGAVAFSAGAAVLPPVWQSLDEAGVAMTHNLKAGEFEGNRIEIALFADNANGLHASKAIAKQIVGSGLPYAFHLGDVYYSGTEHEFAEFFEQPLAPMFDRTELFMLTGNHEMFAKGHWFQDLVRRKADNFPKVQRQRAEMFRLRGPGFQILGVDTMFSGWKGIRLHDRADARVLKILDSWLSERPDDLSILMTTNEPWDLGSPGVTPLYDSLAQTIAGRADLWFWGNVHYGALFEPWQFDDQGSPARALVGSCIGHGGYPFYTQKQIGKLPQRLACRWLETTSRFWPDERVRPDVGNNGWCRLSLERGAARWNIGLTYVDWAGRERLRAKLHRDDGSSIRFDETLESVIDVVGGEPTWRSLGA
jgi:hypothetical protein